MKKQSNRWPLFVRGSMLVVWMGVIFLFSSMPGSGSLYDPPMWYVLERKGAHVFEFAFLSVFAFRFFRVLFDATWRMTAAISAAFVFTYGAFDELHQAFVFGRGSRFSDVGIDVLGSVIALGLIWSIFLLPSLKKFRRML